MIILQKYWIEYYFNHICWIRKIKSTNKISWILLREKYTRFLRYLLNVYLSRGKKIYMRASEKWKSVKRLEDTWCFFFFFFSSCILFYIFRHNMGYILLPLFLPEGEPEGEKKRSFFYIYFFCFSLTIPPLFFPRPWLAQRVVCSSASMPITLGEPGGS